MFPSRLHACVTDHEDVVPQVSLQSVCDVYRKLHGREGVVKFLEALRAELDAEKPVPFDPQNPGRTIPLQPFERKDVGKIAKMLKEKG